VIYAQLLGERLRDEPEVAYAAHWWAPIVSQPSFCEMGWQARFRLFSGSAWDLSIEQVARKEEEIPMSDGDFSCMIP
jgi:hypothetical protein